MIDQTWCRAMAAYNRWMNERLYAASAQLSDALRKEDRGAFFKSVHGTLNHLLYGDRAWMNRFTGKPLEGLSAPGELYADFAALRAAREQLDAQILAWSATLDSTWLAADFTYTSLVDGRTRTRPAWLLVTHMFNHQTHHRGQLTTLLMQFGIDPGVTDLSAAPLENL